MTLWCLKIKGEGVFNFFKKKPLFIIRLSEETGVPPIPVYDKKIVIGRATSHVLSLPDVSISRNHIEVTFREGKIEITDLGTSNGTKVDGEPVPAGKPHLYKEGQIITLGKSTIAIQLEVFRS